LTTDVPALTVGAIWTSDLQNLQLIPIERDFMKKTDAEQLQKRADRQVKNTSGGGHLGGTNFGQAYDAKTSSSKSKGDRVRRNGGKN
jgi:hypothetical protein